jgi:cytochrome c oxidase subunit I
MNLVVHNTAYIPGHLHLTIGTAVTLSYMGITYWLVPFLAGRPLWSRRLALWQTWLWFGGMVIFSSTLHHLGLQGMPRRTMIAQASYLQAEWKTLLPLVGIGGTVLFVSALLYFLNIVLTVAVSRGPAPAAIGFAIAMSGPEDGPAFLDRWRPWLALAFALIVVAYGPMLWKLATEVALTSPGMRVW